MTTRRIVSILGAGALTAALTGPTAAQAATALDCPAGFDLAVVDDLVSAGYFVAPVVDDPASGAETFGRPGNGNGQICIRQMGNRTTHFGGPYYLFTDDGFRSS